MKLHLPKRLFTALMVAMSAFVALTCSAGDSISINFGDNMSETATGSLGGVSVSGWNLVQRSATSNKEVTNQDGIAAGIFSLSGTFGSWQSNVASNGTLTGEVQKHYIDISNHTQQSYTIAVDHDYWITEVIFYMSGDSPGGRFAPINVNGTSYVGGTNVIATDANKSWGNGGGGCTEFTDANTIRVTTSGDLLATNVWVNGNTRATLAGLQIIDRTDELTYQTTLGAGETAAADATWNKNGTNAAYGDIASSDKFLLINTNAAGSTLKLAANDNIQAIGVQSNTLTINADGAVGIANLHTFETAGITVNADITGTALSLTGSGSVTLNGNYELTGLTNTTSLTINGTVAIASGGTCTGLESLTGNGTVELNGNSNIGSAGAASTFSGNFVLKGGTLQLGTPGNNNNMAELDFSKASFDLEGGTIRYSGGNSTLGTVNVNTNSTLTIYATCAGAANQGTLEFLTLNVKQGVTSTISSTWEIFTRVEALTGEGSLVINNSSYGDHACRINSIISEGGIRSITNSAILTMGEDASSTLNVAGGIVNNKTLTVNGTFSISDDLSGFTLVSAGQLGELSVNGTDGYQTTTGSTYLLIDNNNGTVTLNTTTARYGNTTTTLTKNATTGDVTFVGGVSMDATYRVNTRDIVIGGANATANTDRATGLIIAEGRTATLQNMSVESVGALLRNTSGDGTIAIKLESPSTELAITGNTYAGVTGTIDMLQGQIYLGQYNNGTAGGQPVTLNASRIIVRDGAEAWIHLGDTNRSVSPDFDLVSGSSLRNRDGNNVLSGDIRFNIVDPNAATATYNASGKVLLTQFWDKNMNLTGLLSGDGTVEMTAPTQGYTGSWTLSNNGNTFQGSYNLGDAGNGGMKLILAAENAARNATINLNGANSLSTLQINQNATIKGLNSTDADNVVTTNAAATLTVSEGTFAGKLQNGSGSNTLALHKAGTGTLVLSGTNTYTGGTTISGGTLKTSTENSLSTGKVTLNGGTLQLGTNLTVSEIESSNGSIDMGGNTLSTTRLNATGKLNLTSSAILAGELAGSANITGTSLTLLSAANTAQSLTLNSLILGTTDTVSRLTAGSLTTTTLTLQSVATAPSDAAAAAPDAMVKLNSLGGALTIQINEDLVRNALNSAYDKSLVIMELNEATSYDVLLASFAEGGSASTTQSSSDGLYNYSLVWVETGNGIQQLKLQAALNAYSWIGMNDFYADEVQPAFWNNAESWGNSSVPTSSSDLMFDGYGDSQVFVNGNSHAKSVVIDSLAATGTYNLISWNHFELNTNGGGVDKLNVAKNLEVTRGNLLLNVNTSVGESVTVSQNGQLIIAAANAHQGINSAGSLRIQGNLSNTGTVLTQSGAYLSIGGSATNTGDLIITGGEVNISGNLNNTTGELNITGGSLTVGGNVDNTAGSISISGDDTEVSIGGNLTLTDKTDAGKGSLTVGAGSSLSIDGDMIADNLDLEFGGSVTVGNNANINTLTNNGDFTANNALIGVLVQGGNGSITVEGALGIGTISGSGDVNVGENGSLAIDNDTAFNGNLNNKGAISFGDKNVTINAAQNAGDTAGNLTAGSITITDEAIGYKGGSLIMGNLVTNSISIDNVAAGANTARLSINSLTTKTTGEKITLEIAELDDMSISTGNYHLITLKERLNGSLADNFNLDAYDITNTNNAQMQEILRRGLWFEFSSAAPVTRVTQINDTVSNVYLQVAEQTDEQSTWVVGDAQTAANLIVMENGSIKSDNVLDYVRNVVVDDDDAVIDMSGALSRVQLNGLIGGADSQLTITGDGRADTAHITANASGYTGKLNLSSVGATLTGKYSQVIIGRGASAQLNTTNSTIVMNGGSLAGESTMNGGDLAIRLSNASIVAGNNVVDTGDSLNLKNARIVLLGEATERMALDVKGARMKDHVMVDLGNTTSSTGTIAIETSDRKKVEAMGKYFTNIRLEDGKVMADRNTSYYADSVGTNASANGTAGLAMADAILVHVNPQLNQNDTAGLVLDELDKMVTTGNSSAADALGAALAGASTAAQSMALLGDVDRQLKAIRNRTTTMGVNQSLVTDEMPYYNAWINAEGGRGELQNSSGNSGYELNSWGGTVGFDVDLEPTFTAGMAFSAMYGDLQMTGSDTAKGDLDTYYVSAFARYSDSAWTHTFIATAGLADFKLNRSVAGMELEGETSGTSFGLMYEAGRVIALDEDAQTCIQPMFNISWRHTTMDGYSEKGSSAALTVGEQTLDSVTIGLGARLQTVAGESMYNRTSIFECRAMVKADLGDLGGSSEVALANYRELVSPQKVKSSEMGAIGIEAGIGLTVPVGDEGGSIFMDASVEVRSDYRDVNGTLGYRVNF